MNYKISKELFEAVMSFKVIEFYCKNEIQYYPADKERVRCIDWIPTLSGCEYNDFFFKCKEWAINNDKYLHSMPIKYTNGVQKYACRFDFDIDGYYEQEFCSDSEQQVVFDTCMYILDKEKQ